MGFEPVLCLLLGLVIGVSTQGYNGCLDETWSYHNRTHSCFKRPLDPRPWTEARDECKKYLGGVKGDEEGYLAKIDDKETNKFVKALLPANHKAWIGLNQISFLGFYRWEGFSGKPKFLDIIPSGETSYRTFYISSNGWATRKKTRPTQYFCQHNAVIKKTRMSCPTSPVRANQLLSEPLACHFYFTHWKSITWTLTRSNQHVGMCNETEQCQSQMDDYALSIPITGVAKLEFNGTITISHDGGWTCSITSSDDEHLDTKSCDLDVYEPAGDIWCESEFLVESLHVTCRTEKIYPQGSCQWRYKTQDHIEFQPLAVNDTSNFTHARRQDGDDDFRHECSIDLSTETVSFKAGVITVEVSMYPIVNGTDLSAEDDAVRRKEHTVTIELPRKPVFFNMKSGEDITDTQFTLMDGDQFMLECHVDGGTPVVQSTTLECEFPFDVLSQNWSTAAGSVHPLSMSANFDMMNGRVCWCWGQHITGTTNDSQIIFNVLAGPTIDTLTANGQMSNLMVDVNTQVDIHCQASGNPKPMVAMKRTNTFSNDVTLKAMEEYVGISWTPNCTDNGRYMCEAVNQLDGQAYMDKKNLFIRVKCPLTKCTTSDDKTNFTMIPGKPLAVSLCAVAYPRPDDLSNLLLFKEENKEWTIQTKDKMKMDVSVSVTYEIVDEITVTIEETGPSAVGSYKLQLSQDSYIYFQLLLSDMKEDDNNDTNRAEIIIAIIIPLIIVIILVILGVIAYKLYQRKHQGYRPGNNKQESETEPHAQTEDANADQVALNGQGMDGQDKASMEKVKMSENESPESISVNAIENTQKSAVDDVAPKDVPSASSQGDPAPNQKSKPLTYVDVVIVPNSQESVPEVQKEQEKTVVIAPKDESVNYTTIDLKATQNINE